MRKTPNQPDAGRRGRTVPEQKKNRGYDNLEPPAPRYKTAPAQQRRTPPAPGDRQQDYGRKNGAGRPVRYQSYDLDAFEREKSAYRPSEETDFSAFSARRSTPARPPVPEQDWEQAYRQTARNSGTFVDGRAPVGDSRGHVQEPASRSRSNPDRYSREMPPPAVRQGVRRAEPQRRPTASRKTGEPQYKNREEQRRIQNQRRAKRLRRRKITVAVTLLTVVLVAAAVLCCTVFFKVDQIAVNGASLYTEEQILYMLDFKKGDNLLLIQRKQQAESLSNKLPYVKNALVKITLPGKVTVTVEEAEPKYYYQSENGDYAYLDDTMKVLETGASVPPEMEGTINLAETAFKELNVGQKAVFANEEIQKAMEEMLKAIAEVKLPNVTAIKAVNHATNFIIYEDRITIKLGEATTLTRKLTLAKGSIENTGADNILSLPETRGTLDMTVEKHAYFTAETK